MEMSKQPLTVQYYPLLRALTRVHDKKLQRKLLRMLCREKKFKTCVCEIAHNTIKGNIALTAKDKKRINRHSTIVRKILRKKSIDQSGGFLNIVVPLLASVVGEIISSRLKK